MVRAKRQDSITKGNGLEHVILIVRLVSRKETDMWRVVFCRPKAYGATEVARHEVISGRIGKGNRFLICRLWVRSPSLKRKDYLG